MEQVAHAHWKGDHSLQVMEFITDSGRVVDINVEELRGRGVWRRVLTALEKLGIEDRNKVMLAWGLGLIGQWHYSDVYWKYSNEKQKKEEEDGQPGQKQSAPTGGHRTTPVIGGISADRESPAPGEEEIGH